MSKHVLLPGAILMLMPIANADSLTLLDFSMPEVVTQFGVINDGVMGGVSTSRLSPVPGAMVFEGDVSLENNGGFASFRGPVNFADLPAQPEALLLTVRGDQRRYKVTLKLDNSTRTSQYQAGFTAPREWTTLRFEPSDFAASFRGRPVPAPLVCFTDVRYFGLLISDQQSGKFKVELKALGTE